MNGKARIEPLNRMDTLLEEPDIKLPEWIEEIIRAVVAYTSRWRRPSCCDAEFWLEERRSIASLAAWEAYCQCGDQPSPEEKKYVFYKARSAVWTEYRRWIEWCRRYAASEKDWEECANALLDDSAEQSLEQLYQSLIIEEIFDRQCCSSKVRKVFYLWYHEGKTEREIADEMHISKTSVHKILARALDILRQCLSEGDQTLSSLH
ncbi:MAG: sigma-70 family RNA polymerase sigma factor [Armatimonadetes bacterium]|jgi:RNA polymerase sigma factor (sigma-70 family)|nr:MAG: sigma-70 family RNA polymerase sigma factor [Armatimonadota bacterium]